MAGRTARIGIDGVAATHGGDIRYHIIDHILGQSVAVAGDVNA